MTKQTFQKVDWQIKMAAPISTYQLAVNAIPDIQMDKSLHLVKRIKKFWSGDTNDESWYIDRLPNGGWKLEEEFHEIPAKPKIITLKPYQREFLRSWLAKMQPFILIEIVSPWEHNRRVIYASPELEEYV